MNVIKTLICFTLIIVASSDSLRDLTSVTDFASFASMCTTTTWTTNQSCFIVQYPGYQCCAGSLTALGNKITTCYPQALTTSTTTSAGVSGIATISYVCSTAILQISIILTFVMFLLF